jgi:LexA-binding, inner membrane-associated putative hydrolase
MPSPVGHALAGLTVHLAAARDLYEVFDWRRASVVVGAALAPDLDLLFRLFDGRNHHGNEAHSVGCALAAAAVTAVAARMLGMRHPLLFGAAAGAGWASHVLLDYLNVDTHPPIGIMALWPFSRGYYKVPWPVFLDIGRTLDWETALHDALAIAWEAVVLLPVVMVAWRLRLGRGG